MIKAGIVGGTGYTGVELLRLLSQHRDVELTMITSRKEAGTPVAEMYPSLRGFVDLPFTDTASADLTRCDVVFYATPHGVAMADAPKMVEAGVKIIDLAADFRLQDPAVFEQWYKLAHSCPDLLAEAAYGLPEINRAAIAKARIVANPGCYPTTMQLGFAPLLRRGLVDAAHLIADCKSGVSGAGRKAELGTAFSEASDNFKAYGVTGHRHHPETVERLQLLSAEPVGLVFTPHLVPMIRGMHATLYARLKPDALGTDVQKLYEDAYRDEPFVDVLPTHAHPDTRSTRASNMLRIAVHRPDGDDGDTVVLLVVQDNLVKGAAGQAVQCMNLMFGLPETTGLLHVPVLP